MSEYIEPMFAVPIFHLYAEDWDRKKKLLQDISSQQKLKKDPGEYVKSDFRAAKADWSVIEPLIRDELRRFKEQVKVDLQIDAYWFSNNFTVLSLTHLPIDSGTCPLSWFISRLTHTGSSVREKEINICSITTALRDLAQSCILIMIQKSTHLHSLCVLSTMS